MALEVIGGIASILQLAGTVYTISKTLYEVGEALSNAPSDIKDLARDLETFSDELHLLSTLLHGKDGRYADQVYRLTAKIIGDCATICTKIDRIIRKLRSGSVLAKIKWLYKEKEIMKLLARLRDLKLSLMGTLSVLSALRADNMMDSLGINNPSLIGGPKRHGLSTETRMQVEDTRLKLAGMSMKDTTGASSRSKTMLPSSASLVSGGSSSTLSTSATSLTYVDPPTTRVPSTTNFSASSFISMAVVPNSMPPIINTQVNQSVDSFHSALSSQNQDSLNGQMKPVQSFLNPEDPNHVPVIPQSVIVSDGHDKPSFSAEESRQPDTSVSKSLESWRNEMALSAMRHFNMNVKDAGEWANKLPIPSNLSAITEPTVPAEILPHPENGNKPQEPKKGRLGADSEERASPVGNPADPKASMSLLDLLLSKRGCVNDQLSERDHPNLFRRSGAHKLQDSNNPEILQSSGGLHGFRLSRKTNLASIAYRDSDYSISNDGSTDSSVVPQENQNFAAVETRLGLERIQRQQIPQSSTQQNQLIRTQYQQQQQQQQQMARLSPHRLLEITDRFTGVDVERWRNVDACPSMEMSANMPSGLYELETGDPIPKPQPQEIQVQRQAPREACKRDEQPSYPSISLCGKSEPRGLMEFSPDYTDGISGQVFKSSKSDESNDISTFHFQNEISRKGLGGFWLRGLINVESFDAVIWRNLQQYLIRERVYTTLEAGSNLLLANLDWSATPYNERITLRRQIFPRAASSIQKILDVLAVMEETIGLSIGAIAWACLLGAVENLLSHGPNWTVDSQTKIITEMSEIVSIIARYTVMENIYAQWKGMSLDKDYEQSLINLSTHVLIYLGAFVPSFSETSTSTDMKPYFDKIIEADTACRGFTVIVSAENSAIDRKRSLEESSDDSDHTEDPDGTVLRVEGDDELNNMPSSAKRIKT